MDTEVRMYFGRCRCCLEYGYLKYMFFEHKHRGQVEIYGEMLKNCFNFSWIQLDTEDYNQICDPCIKKLREACSFRNLVIRSQKQLLDEICNSEEPAIKVEYINEVEQDSLLEPVQWEGNKVSMTTRAKRKLLNRQAFDEDESENPVNTKRKAQDDKSNYYDIEDRVLYVKLDEFSGKQTVVPKSEVLEMDSQEIEEMMQNNDLPGRGVYEEVEYLDEEFTDNGEQEKKVKSVRTSRKRAKKLPGAEHNEEQLGYKEEDLKSGVEAVRNNRMSRLEAVAFYNLSLKTLDAKLNMHEKSKRKSVSRKKSLVVVENEEALTEVRQDDKIGFEKGTYVEIEYLEEDAADNVQEENDVKPVANVTRKWPKKLPRAERNKRYLQYTEDDLRNAVDDVKNNKMTRLEAAEFYKVPRKTLDAKLRTEDESIDPAREEMYKFIKEIKEILTFTNATPYRSKMTTFSCAYCTEVYFHAADELRNHTRMNHIDERTKKVDLMMRPHSMNETLKLDINNLMCVVCCIPINDWNDMFRHLKNTHGTVFTYAHKRLIPYILNQEPDCVLCKQHFTNYVQLDVHMNSHYDNYVCDDCGQTFISAARLKNHSKKHDLGKYSCKYCNKVFTLKHYVKKHEAVVHKSKVHYKCYHCPERLPSDKERKEHIEANHREKVKEITCDICGKIFNWRQYYIGHLRKVHGDRKYACTACDKKFAQRDDLKRHIEARHKGLQRIKNHICPVCDKRYSSKSALVTHFRIHSNDDEKIVEADKIFK
ncbi:protein suppressor of hairy wing-like isoform X1 [Bombyx mandarina]|uniref:Protein suppressor of hairy wing-like isoform X1 n=1 Tax=Bombyx mandarina TaxID=7092 RepID=A0A6J2JKB7_BOMMA|nr:protein suppressor of hairy wing-like isoform X1 [Bombyx mandarina]